MKDESETFSFFGHNERPKCWMYGGKALAHYNLLSNNNRRKIMIPSLISWSTSAQDIRERDTKNNFNSQGRQSFKRERKKAITKEEEV